MVLQQLLIFIKSTHKFQDRRSFYTLEKQVTIHIADTTFDHVGGLLAFAEEMLPIKYTNKNPDFIVHSCFGKTVLKYSGVRIAVLGENLVPDFNISDYAFGFSRMSFSDRY